jgi:hypothetical protein
MDELEIRKSESRSSSASTNKRSYYHRDPNSLSLVFTR